MLLGLLACASPVPEPAEDSDRVDTAAPADTAPTTPFAVDVLVTLDGVPWPGALVVQAGREAAWRTGEDGHVTVDVDPAVPGSLVLVASWPDAWNVGQPAEGPGELTLALTTFDTTDNPAYTFADPGEHAHADSTASQCGHCHLSLHEGWAESPHRSAAKNPGVQAVFQGLDLTRADAAACADAGGTWGSALEPGTGAAVDACHVAAPTPVGAGCADCHAPAIGGATVAGHELTEATGLAYEYGVSCDVCHKVATVTPGAAPGVAGWLGVLRPLDPSPSPLLGAWHPLQFGPYPDVVNPAMGAVYRQDLHEAAFCGGCHQLDQAVLVEGEALDPTRWPDGTLPIQSTYAEWEAGPMNPAAPCQSCHMPPLPDVGNAADLGNVFELVPGVAGGWYRSPGAVRAHSWVGPRQPDSGMLEAAALVDLDTELSDGVLDVTVEVQNVGPGHAIPTGEPLRNLVLRVEATCDGEPLRAIGGDVVPDWGGASGWATAPEPLDRFVGAAPGDRVRLARTAGWKDYVGFGPFGDGSFGPEARGVVDYALVGDAEVVAVATDGTVTLDHPEWLALADTAWWVRAADVGETGAVAGLPGFGFARVLVGADGARMVPHAAAVDVASDNRLLPGEGTTTRHQFAATCEAPEVTATLRHRAWPWAEARRYGQELEDRVMATVTR